MLSVQTAIVTGRVVPDTVQMVLLMHYLVMKKILGPTQEQA